ncbi:chemotaxis protein CheA [Hydrogenophaga pseudoflava]|uniref:chemotaxis protein CheA n=1 Tax=Hydrogenophaga pseudoflava TaxID=47421 RepID=UPI0027E55571|nr:chemotaxis protein CheA [Hydrogenophaga pseudoflava]MDQ7746104.1 chemotaxis protein CheA [Hydrogenophaga pseudoflava]
MNAQDADQSFIAEALPAFISESDEQLEAIEQLLLELEDQPGNGDLLGALFRCAHTVKGSAGIFGLDEVVAFTHHVETLLDRLRDGLVAFTPDMGTLLLQCNDQIRFLIRLAQAGGAVSADEAAARAGLESRLQAFSGDAPMASHAAPPPNAPVADAASAACVWTLQVGFLPDTFRNGMDPLAILNYLRGLGTITRIHCDRSAVPGLDTLDPESCHLAFGFELETAADQDAIEAAFSFVREDCTLQITPPAPPVADAPAAVVAAPEAAVRTPAVVAKPREGGEEQRFIRVQADRLDAVINLLGELVIAGAGASLLARQSRQGSLIEANEQINQLIEEIRNGTLQLRMVPIGETFSRFRRVVRDTAAELGKEVQLEIVGGDTELDKSVVERIADPLMHLVRNALDHGLETPEQRTAAGKPAQGRLVLSACHESGSILIRITDDGRGVQRQKVLARAWERGLVEPGVVPADADILKLIFAPGFSTAEKVTNLSGRGVGMDVVRSNIEALRGTVQLTSEEGAGSTIEIRLPLTLAIIDGFLIGVGDSRFIFPLDAVVEVIESRSSATEMDASGRGVTELRGQALPVVSLRKLYALDSPEPDRVSIVVIRFGGQRYGVLVDQLLGQHQTVIKPLGRMFRSLRGMSGSSILGNGDVALIFDVASLCQLAIHPPSHARPRHAVSPQPLPSTESAPAEGPAP